MQTIILNIINTFGYLGIFLLIAIENIFPPIPSEVILTFGGFATTISKMTFIGTFIAATLGAIVGAVALYVIGYILNVDRINKLFDSKLGKRLHLHHKDLDKAVTWFDKYETKAVFFGRFIPIVRSLVSIPAGMAKMKFTTFLFLTTLGTAIWNLVLIYLGVLAGKNWETVANYFDIYSKVALIGLALIGLVLLIKYISYRRKKSID